MSSNKSQAAKLSQRSHSTTDEKVRGVPRSFQHVDINSDQPSRYGSSAQVKKRFNAEANTRFSHLFL